MQKTNRLLLIGPGWVFTAVLLIIACTNANTDATKSNRKESLLVSRGLRQPQQTAKKMSNTDIMLEQVPDWSLDQVDRMKKAWITTAAQVVALSATTNGVRSIAEQLNVSESEAMHLINAARETLSPSMRTEMGKPADTSQYGLGSHQSGQKTEDE